MQIKSLIKLKEILLQEHSKKQCIKIVNWVGSNPKKFDQLFQCYLDCDQLIAQRASWPFCLSAVNHPEFINKHLKDIIHYLHKPNLHPAVIRNTLRLIQHISLHKKHHGFLINFCFEVIISKSHKVAAKAFSLTILYNLSQKYNDIKSEIKLVIEANIENETAAFKARAKKILRKLEH